ncbi:MAG: hypothetical protein ACPGF6_02940 [Porticoccaceae bacterium]
MDISAREKNIWIEFTITAVVSLYYFYSSYRLSGWTEIASYEMGILVMNVIILSVVASIILYALFARENPEQKDERDLAIESRGNALGYYSLTILCSILIGIIMLSEGILLIGETGSLTGQTSGINSAIAMHLILIALMISALFKQATQLFFYRRG